MRPRLLLLDLDGTVIRGGQAVPGAVEALRKAIQLGILVRYISNNSTLIISDKIDELNSYGLPCEAGWLYATGPYVAQKLNTAGVKTAYVIGEPPLHSEIAGVGISSCTEDEAVAGRAEAVVVGLCRSFDYTMMRTAHRSIQSGAAFWATNADASFPMEGGSFDPGAGALVASIETASGVKAKVVGKPEPDLLIQAMTDLGVDRAETLVIGDRLDTDIEAGRRAGCPTWLVLTGVEQSIPSGQAGSADLRGLAATW